MSEYEKSKALTTIEGLSCLPASLKESVLSSDESIASRQKSSQALADAVCDALGIKKIKVCVRDSRQLYKNKPHSSSTRFKTLGRCWLGKNIEIWNKTAKTQKVVAIKTFYNTLLHELSHHIDWFKLGLAESLHTSGFYQRISYLDSCFK